MDIVGLVGFFVIWIDINMILYNTHIYIYILTINQQKNPSPLFSYLLTSHGSMENPIAMGRAASHDSS